MYDCVVVVEELFVWYWGSLDPATKKEKKIFRKIVSRTNYIQSRSVCSCKKEKMLPARSLSLTFKSTSIYGFKIDAGDNVLIMSFKFDVFQPHRRGCIANITKAKYF